jgi:hypothetical protein
VGSVAKKTQECKWKDARWVFSFPGEHLMKVILACFLLMPWRSTFAQTCIVSIGGSFLPMILRANHTVSGKAADVEVYDLVVLQ